MASLTAENSNFEGWVGLPRGFNKTFSKASEGHLDEFERLIKVGEFSVGDPHNRKHYHSIQWAAEAMSTCRREGKEGRMDVDISNEMHDMIFEMMVEDSQVIRFLQKDENSENYFSPADYTYIMSL
jgi:hypothetical protein